MALTIVDSDHLKQLMAQAICPHKNILIHLDGLLATEPGRLTWYEPERKIKASAVCSECQLRGPWITEKKKGLPRPRIIRRAISEFYREANKIDDRVEHLFDETKKRIDPRLNELERSKSLFKMKDLYLKED